MPAENDTTAPNDFIRDIVARHVAEKRYAQIVTRFPPEPNGYLHIGHAKAICLDIGIAQENGGRCNLRMDDTNPAKENVEYVNAILRDVRWLIANEAVDVLALKPRGQTPRYDTLDDKFDFYQAPGTSGELEPFFTSDYFDQLYAFAVRLIERGKAYVCDLSREQIDEYRCAPEKPGRDSPWRERSIQENLDLFQRMKKGEFPEGQRTLRAKIDMAAPNLWLRDPLLYRIRHASHHQTGDKWCIYPMYDFAHCLGDYIEGVTHSICTLEFEVHRPLYDWILENLDLPRTLPCQYEFAPLRLGYTIFSKRRLLKLVEENVVTGWDDPRMPTLAGARRRGIPASAIRELCRAVGVTKFNSVTDVALFEHAIRRELNRSAPRRLAVLRPLKLVLTNIPEGEVIEVNAINNPEDESAGTRKISFTREVFIEGTDFMEDPPKKYFRLRPGGEVRLKYACIIQCDEVIKDDAGRVVELRGTADLDSRAGGTNAGKKVKGTIHWVSVNRAVEAEVRLYDRLFNVEDPAAAEDFIAHVNPDSVSTVTAQLEPALCDLPNGIACQFERLGYFISDEKDSNPDRMVFNRTITLRDTWAKRS